MLRSPHALLVLTLVALIGSPLYAQTPTFESVVIDADNPKDPHCKTLGDFSGDGFLDAVVASSSGGGLFWYEYPAWTKHEIRASGSWTTDMQATDIDADGDIDIVLPNGSGLQWYENPLPLGDPRVDLWTEHTIGSGGSNNHDVEVIDGDGDGDIDVFTRRKSGNGTYFWRQETPITWTQITISLADGEGIGLGDLDGDGDPDVAQNGSWVEQIDPVTWVEHDMGISFAEDVGATVADIDGDGTNDIILAPSESAGRFSWFEAVDPINGPWVEHEIDPSVSFLHTFKIADMDFDGDLDMITAEMHQSSDPDEVSVYLNEGGGLTWSQLVISTTGSHNVRIGDIGNDADIDVFGANWNDSAPNSAVVELWENTSGPLTLDSWERHIVETSLPWQSVFVDGKDLDGNGLPDLIVGGWWYSNPGDLAGDWTRTTIGAPLDNMAAVYDFDRDGDLDILGTNGRENGNDFSWAQNDGTGQFANLNIANTVPGGDFLQGVDVGQLLALETQEVVLSWHNGAGGTSVFSIPVDPTDPNWPITTLSTTTNEEQSPIADFDGDGDLDVHLGDNWLRQEADGSFSTLAGVVLGAGVPDRVVPADIDGDGDLDVAIGVEFSDRLVWAENENGDGSSWVERLVATDFDYFSVDAEDIDKDGDIDIVGGAHKGNGEVTLYENTAGDGLTWTPHVVDGGDSSVIDHHDGTQLVDMDLDGDLDIISVGWTKRSLVIYENLAIDPLGDVVAPRIDRVLALGDPRRVTVTFNEPIDATTGETIANYTISDGVAVGNAMLGEDDQSVTLAVTPLSQGIVYTLTVNNVEDLAGNPIAPNSEATFVFVDGEPTDGLIAHWPLDQAAGAIAIDATGNGRNGTLTNGAGWISGPALALDGNDDYVDVGTLDIAGEGLTISAWIYSTSLGNCSANDCRILSKATGTAESDHYYMLSTIDSGGETRLRFRLKTDGVTSTLIAGSGALVENEWTLATATYDGSEMRLYLDGNLIGSLSKSGSITTNAGVETWIGGNPPSASEKPWPGRIDDVRIYDRALSEAEILSLPDPSRELHWEVVGP